MRISGSKLILYINPKIYINIAKYTERQINDINFPMSKAKIEQCEFRQRNSKNKKQNKDNKYK